MNDLNLNINLQHTDFTKEERLQKLNDIQNSLFKQFPEYSDCNVYVFENPNNLTYYVKIDVADKFYKVEGYEDYVFTEIDFEDPSFQKIYQKHKDYLASQGDVI